MYCLGFGVTSCGSNWLPLHLQFHTTGNPLQVSPLNVCLFLVSGGGVWYQRDTDTMSYLKINYMRDKVTKMWCKLTLRNAFQFLVSWASSCFVHVPNLSTRVILISEKQKSTLKLYKRPMIEIYYY